MGTHPNPTRREFIKAASTAVAAPYVITSTALGNADRPPASDRIVMGGIGIGNMGRGDMGNFLGRADVQYVAVSDVRTSSPEEFRGLAATFFDHTLPAALDGVTGTINRAKAWRSALFDADLAGLDYPTDGGGQGVSDDHLAIWVNLTERQWSRIDGLEDSIMEVIFERFRLAQAGGVEIPNPHGNARVVKLAPWKHYKYWRDKIADPRHPCHRCRPRAVLHAFSFTSPGPSSCPSPTCRV